MTSLLAVLVSIASAAAPAERAKSPAEATVFIRVIANVHVELEDAGVRREFDRERVEVQSGSGFVISSFGYILTNHHVITPEDRTVSSGLMKRKATFTQPRIEVCFPAGGGTGACSQASVYASDPALDLAVLYITVPNLAYLALGDSDVITGGETVEALGYPYGRRVEVGLDLAAPVETHDVVPEITTTPGAISATRSDDAGDRRFLQMTNTVNPGNSGGPLVDHDGFAVGVVTMKLREATGIGFAIPVNQVKDFLDLHGIDAQMPTRRLRLGPVQALEAKGMAVRLPETLGDVSPFRARVETDEKSDAVALRIDRVWSPLNSKQILQALLGTQSFESIVAAPTEARHITGPGETRALTGWITGIAPDTNREIGMEYAILDLGAEKLVARYVGPIESIAFNTGVLRDSLVALDGRPLVSGLQDPIDRLQWTPLPMTDGQTRIAMPSGWFVEPRGPAPCGGLPPSKMTLAASPMQDFTIAMRAAVWSAEEVSVERGASACSSRRASAGAAYATRAEWLGVSYTIDGAFARFGDRKVVQVEVIAPADKNALARELLAAWMRTLAAAER